MPIYAVKTSSPSNLLRALRTLLGIDPSAGGTFARRQDEEEEEGGSSRSAALAAAAAGTAFVREQQPPGSTPKPAVHGNVVSRVRWQAGRIPLWVPGQTKLFIGTNCPLVRYLNGKDCFLGSMYV